MIEEKEMMSESNPAHVSNEMVLSKDDLPLNGFTGP